MGYTRPGFSSSRISQNPYRVGQLSELGYLYFLISKFTDDVRGRIAATLSYVAERNGEENVAYVRPRPALPEVDGGWREAHAARRARGHPSNQGDVREMPQSQAHRWPLRSLGGGRQGLQVGGPKSAARRSRLRRSSSSTYCSWRSVSSWVTRARNVAATAGQARSSLAATSWERRGRAARDRQVVRPGPAPRLVRRAAEPVPEQAHGPTRPQLRPRAPAVLLPAGRARQAQGGDLPPGRSSGSR